MRFLSRRLFTVPYFFVRSFRYTASYRHGYCTVGAGNRPRPLSSFDTQARWQPVTQSARSRRSNGKIEDCEQSIYRGIESSDRYYSAWWALKGAGEKPGMRHLIKNMVVNVGSLVKRSNHLKY